MNFEEGASGESLKPYLKDIEWDYIQFHNFEKEDFFLNLTSKTKKYQEGKILKNCHWGQLKLFVSELVVLNDISEKITDILYIGAAPGDHLFVLAQLYKDITFHLYDSEEFDSRIKKLKNINIHQKYFDESCVQEWSQSLKDIFLISDIRSLTYNPDEYEEGEKWKILNEKEVWENMTLQKHWVEKIKPKFSLLKFRLPFAYDFVLKEGKTRNYLNSKIYKQIFNKPNSSETRLFVEDIEEKEWDLKWYEESLCYHNSIVRENYKYFNPIDMSKNFIFSEMGLFNDFDSTYFTFVLIEYLKKRKLSISKDKISKLLKFILTEISMKKRDLLEKRL